MAAVRTGVASLDGASATPDGEPRIARSLPAAPTIAARMATATMPHAHVIRVTQAMTARPPSALMRVRDVVRAWTASATAIQVMLVTHVSTCAAPKTARIQTVPIIAMMENAFARMTILALPAKIVDATDVARMAEGAVHACATRHT